MKKLFLLLGGIALIGVNSWGQTSRMTKQTFAYSSVSLRSKPAKSASSVPASIPTPPAHRTCASVEYNKQLAQQYPQLRGTDAQFEQWISQKIQQEQTNRLTNNGSNANSTQATLIKIPVVVHVIHNGQAVGTAPNISAAQIQSQIDVLNEDFRKKVGTLGYNTNAAGADMEIEFVLALRNPSGTTLAEPGIHRYNGGAASYTINTIESTIKPATSWDPTKYLNLWTLTFGGSDASTLGYAQFPNSSGLSGLNANEGVSNTDGVVIGATYFGRTGTVSAPYNKGRTATHEIGHWLGLRHIWGDASCGTDYCNDTPVHAEENYAPTSNPNGCFTHPKSNTCGTADEMFENYMDYTNDACMNIFTNDQKSRMRTVMTNSPRRAELINSTVATPTGVPVPSFTSNTDGGCAPVTITYTSTSTGSPTSYSWSFPGGTPSTSTAANPTVTYSTAGAYDVTLTVSNASGSASTTSSQYVFVGDATTSALPMSYGFETNPMPTGWLIGNPDADTTWRRANVGGFGASSYSAFIDNYNYNGSGKIDAIYTAKYNFSNATSSQLKFDVAYAAYSAADADTLLVYYSTDCGNTFTPFYKKGGNTLSTNGGVYSTSSFVPTATQWRTETITLPTVLNGKADVMFAFVNKCDYGNNLYLDNINLTTTVPSVVANFGSSSPTICMSNTVAFYSTSTGNPTSFSWSFPGGTPSTSTSSIPIVTYNTPGTYSVIMTASNASGSNTITKTNYITVLGSTVSYPIPFTETFESTTFPPTADWKVANPDADTYTWIRSGTVGGFGTSTASAMVNNYNNSTTGRKDTLYTPYIDFTTATNPNFDFDVAYAPYNASSTDTLIVLYTIDCGQTYKQLSKKGGLQLSSIASNTYYGTGSFIPTATQWYTLYTVASDWEGRKVKFAFVNKTGYGNNLYIDNIRAYDGALPAAPVAAFTSNKDGGCAPLSVAFTDQSTNTPTSWSWSFPGGTPATSTAQNPTVTYSTPGIYNVTLTAINAGGSNTITQASYIIVGSTTPTALPLSENFEGTTFPSTGWGIYNPEADTTWRKVSTAGGYANSASSVMIKNFSNSKVGTLDGYSFPTVNLTTITSPRLVFDVAYARHSAGFSDTLIVAYSTDCGATYNVLWKKGGSDLSSTGIDQTTTFTPTATQWKTETVSLASIATMTNVKLIFINKNGYGNNLYLDNILINSSSIAIAPNALFTSNKTGGCTGTQVQFTDQSTNTPTSWAWSFPGGTPSSSTAQNPLVTYSTAGTYNVVLTVANSAGTNTVTKSGYITILSNSTVSLPVTADFESTTFPPSGWILYNIDADTTWRRTTTASGFGTSTASAMIRYYSYNNAGRLDGFISPKVNFSGLVNPEISFDVAYARYNSTNIDSLYVMASTDCGLTFTTVWKKGGTELSTNGGTDLTSPFTPTATQWRRDAVALQALKNAGPVQLALIGRNGYGNNMYLDNINIAESNCTKPVATVTPSATNICTGGVAALVLSSTIPNTTFTWTISTTGTVTGASAGSGTAIAQSLSGAGTVTYTVTPMAGTCYGLPVSKTITVNATPTASASATATDVCAGSPIQLNAVTVANATYSWSGPNGFSSTSQNPTITNATTAASGNYALTVTVNGCTSPVSSFDIVVSPKPTASASSTTTSVCAGSTVQLNAATVANATYAWTGPNGFTSTLQNPTIANATTAASGNYALTVTVNGCTSTASTVAVTVKAKPTVTATTTTSMICAGGTIQLNGSTVANASYAWSGPNGFTSTLQNPTIANATTAAAGNYALTVTVNGCTSTVSSVDVVVNALPTASASAAATSVCAGSTVQLNAATVANASYAWTGPNGFTSTLQNPTIANATTAATGTYSLTVTTNGCASTASTVAVTVKALPTVTASTTTATLCAGGTIQLNGSTVANASYAWTGPNGFSSTSQNPTVSNVTTAATGTYSLTVTVNGCTSTASTVAVTVNPIPTASASATANSVCAGSTVQLNAATVANATYAWTGPNGFTSTSQNPTIAGATTAASGNYALTVTVNGCTSAISSVDVLVNELPTASASAAATSVCVGSAIELSAASVDNATYAWTGPNGFTSTSQNPTLSNVTANATGTYSLTVTTNGCASTASTVVVTVNPIPNAPTTTNSSLVVCQGTEVATLPTATGTGLQWYADAALTTPLNVSNPNAPTAAELGFLSDVAGDKIVYVTQNVAGCPSLATSCTLTVNVTPDVVADVVASVVCEGSPINFLTTAMAGATYLWTGPNGFSSTEQNPSIAAATTAATGTYTLVVTLNGCAKTSTVNAAVNALPNVLVITQALCEGGTLQLSTEEIDGASYAWTGPNGFSSTDREPTVSPLTNVNAGQYNVTVTLVGGCSYQASSYQITVSAVPTTPVITVSNDTLFATAGAATYTWLLSGTPVATTSENYYLVPTTGLYSVLVANTGSCASDTSVAVLGTAIGIKSTLNKQISVYPNPSAGIYQVTATEGLTTGTVRMEIYDLNGRKLNTFSTESTAGRLQHTLDLREYAAGSYILKVTNAAGVGTYRLVKSE